MMQFIYREMVMITIKRIILIVCAAVLGALLLAGAYQVFCAL